MTNPKIQGEVEFVTTQAEEALGRVEQRGEKMANSLVKSGEKAQKGTSTIGDGADAAAQKFTRAEGQIAASIQRRTALLESAGKGERAYAEARIKSAGLSVDKFGSALDALSAAEAKTKGVTAGLNTMGMSAKQFSANMRGVPAQFTDIITSLQGGQRPLTVLLQQGGQLKDMFGGTGNAAKALGGYVLGLINPYTLAAGAVGALALAYYQGRQETEAYNKALIMSGNVAGTSAGQLSEIAKSIAGGGNTSIGSVATALAEIAATGKVSADVIGKVARAAVDMEKVGGAAASETVKEFAALGDSPVAAILKLNDKYHFLTESVYSQIRALEEQGRVTDAAKAAQLAYADAIEGRIPSLNENLGLLEKAWRGVSNVAKLAWDNMLGAGRESTLEEQLAKATAAAGTQTAERGNGNFGTRTTPGSATAQRDVIRLQAEIESRDRQSRMSGADQQREKEAIAGSQSLDALKKNLRTKEELVDASNKKIAKDAAAVNASTPGKYSDTDIAKLQKAEADRINGPAKKASGGSVAPVDKSQLAFDLAQIKQATDEQVGMYSNAEKVMQAMRSANLIEEGDYYEAKAAFIRLNSETQEADLQKQIDRMSREKLSGKEKIDNDRKILETEEKLAKLRRETTTNLTINSIQTEAANKRIHQSYEDAQSAAKAYLDTVARQNEREVAGIGRGREYNSNQSAINQIEDKFTSKRTTLDDDKRRGQITQDEYDTYLKIAQDTYDKEVVMHSDTRNKILAAQGDWKNGMTEAYENYMDESNNVAKKTSEMFTKAYSTIETSMSDFLFDPFDKGVKGMAQAFGSMIKRMIADSLAADLTNKLMGKVGTANSGGWFSDIMKLFGGGSSSAAINTGAGSGFDSALWGMQSFAVGTDYVPRDMVAKIHQGERIIPAAQNNGSNQKSNQPLSIVVNVNGSSSAPDVRRAAGQGAREALAAFNGAGRYR